MPKEIIIIGGGIAGLTAATQLSGFRVTVLEAKNRFGGRIHTLKSAGNVIETGAEFIHGESKSLLGAIRSAGLDIQPASPRNQVHEGNRLTPINLWEQWGELSKRIEPKKRDISFLSFINEEPLSEPTKRMMVAFVSGFNAADPGQISAHSLRLADYSSEHMNGDQQSRLRTGYSDLVNSLEARARSAGANLLKNVEVRTVRWKAGQVHLEALTENHTETFSSDAVILTLPLGVLKSGAVVFQPALPEKQEAIAGLQFGHAVKIVLVFRKHWWLERDFGFIHSLDEPLQTWWSDPRGPVLTGWAGGPKAELLLRHSPEELEEVAIATLSRLFAVPEKEVRSHLVASHTHNWSNDPHVRGAYSYIPVDGLFLPKQLGAPVENTLFFAGEATATDAQLGTVFAALESGERVAREVKAVLHDC